MCQAGIIWVVITAVVSGWEANAGSLGKGRCTEALGSAPSEASLCVQPIYAPLSKWGQDLTHE